MSSFDIDREMDVISVSSYFKGDFRFGRYARIEGCIDGTIKSTGTLIIGDQAKVKANIDGQTVVINGYLTGNVNAENIVCVGEMAEVNGTITAPNVEISDGAKINGNVVMGKFHPQFRDIES